MKKVLLSVMICMFVVAGMRAFTEDSAKQEKAAPTMSAADFKTLYDEGDAAYKKQKYADAATKLSEAQPLASTPWHRFAVSYRLAQCFFYLKKYPECIAEAQKARQYERVDNKSHNILSNRIAESYLQLEKYEEALRTIETQLISPKQEKEAIFQTMLLKGQVLMKQRKNIDAISAFKACEALPPPSMLMRAKTNWFIGIVAVNQGDIKTAETYFSRNLKIDGGWFTGDSKRRLKILNRPSATRNLLPNGSFEYGSAGAWNRMIDQSYLVTDNQWVLDAETAFHGRYSMRSKGGSTLVLQGEGNFSNGYFSIYLKSAVSHARVKLEVFTYKSFTPLMLANEVMQTTSEWSRYTVRLKRELLPMEPAATPVTIRITPLTNTTVWADAAQLETPDLTAYHDYQIRLRPAEEAQKILRERFAHPAPNQAFPSSEAEWELNGNYSFRVKYPQNANAVPITVGLPLPRGVWQGGGKVAVRSADGRLHPAQAIISGRWVQDGSVRAAAVSFIGDLKAGINSFSVESSAIPPAARQMRMQEPDITIFAADAQLQQYGAREILRRIECDGAVFRTELRRGILCNAAGMALAEYSLRTRVNHSDGAMTLEFTVINPNAEELVLSSAGLKVASGKPGEPARYFQAYSQEKKSFILPPDSGCGFVRSAGGTLLMREASLRHPAELEVNKDGDFTAWLWPSGVRKLILSRKMGFTREFIYSPSNADDVPARLGVFPVAMAAPETFIKSGFFLLPLGMINDKAPYAKRCFEAISASLALKSSEIFTNANRILHGAFNYGDVYGDSGWGNLESYLDLAEFWLSVGTGDLDMFGSALNRARHYRDVDVIDGSACYHSSNHSGGVRYDFSHSWPQGIIIHYLMTGDPRSAEVLERMIEQYLSREITDKNIQDSRSLGRYLLGLADFYALTGREDIKKRFFAQMEHAEKNNLGPRFKDQTLFHWLGRTDPFHVWYGACALMEMYQMTGEPRLLKAFKREMDASLNMDFFRHDLNELWPGLPLEEAWPIQLGYHSHHRGSLFYPLMRFYAENCGKPEYRRIAALAAYTEFLRGEPYPGAMDILRTAVLENQSEQELLGEALNLRRRAAAHTLLNGDFSKSVHWFHHWHLPASRQMSYDDIVESWPLCREQDFRKNAVEYRKRLAQISPWRSYARNYGYMDQEYFHEAPPSLRVTVGKWSPGGSTAWLESAPVWLPKGAWKLSGAFKMDSGVDPAKSVFICSYTAEKENKRNYRFHPGTGEGKVPVSVWYGVPNLLDVSALFSNSRHESWRKYEFRFTSTEDGIVTMKFIVLLESGTSVGHAWFDDIKLEKVNK